MRELPLPFTYPSIAFLKIAILILLAGDVQGQVIRVYDEFEHPIMGVEVFSDDYAISGTTDNDGEFDLGGAAFNKINLNFLGFGRLRLSGEELARMNYLVKLQPDAKLIEEIVILGRSEASQSEIPYKVETITRAEIASTQAQTSADAMDQHGGVFIQKSQMGGGSPVIRGFEANRVLLVVDGVRLNNAIYRSGHLQNAITIDPAILERMDVIYGPNSLVYGSDALGGVVHFRTLDPDLSLNGSGLIKGSFYGRYASANREKSSHFDITVAGEKMASLTSITFSDYDDLRSGNNRDKRFPDFGKRSFYQGLDSEGRDIQVENDNFNIQVGTGYRQFDVLQKLRWKPNLHEQVILNVQYSTSSDVPRYDNLTEIRNGTLRWGEWNYGPQKRLLTALTYKNLKPTLIFDQAIIIGSYQRIDEVRIQRRFGDRLREIQQEDVHVVGTTVDFTKYLDDDHTSELDFGLDIQHNRVKSDARGVDIFNGLGTPEILSRYASDKNRLTTMGAFFYWRKKTANKWFNWNAGMRYSYTSYSLRYRPSALIDWPAEFISGISGNNNALTWSLGATMNHPEGWQLRGMISTAFRAPNIDDLSKIRINANEITFPNLNLQPERSINAELTLARHFSKHLAIGITGFITRLNDAIIQDNFTTPGGLSEWISRGDTLRVVANQNISSARIAGVSANVDWTITKDWAFKSTINFTSGRELDPDVPLAHIPPLYGQSTLKYTSKAFTGRLVLRYNGQKDIADFGGSADNPDLATPLGSLSWTTINSYVNIRLLDKLNLSLAVENIMDSHYRVFSSGVSAPGRNFIISLRGNF